MRIRPVECAKKVGILFDIEMSITTPVSKAQYLSEGSQCVIMRAFLTYASWLEYCNSLMYGLPNINIFSAIGARVPLLELSWTYPKNSLSGKLSIWTFTGSLLHIA